MNSNQGTRLLQLAVALFAIGLLALVALFLTPALTDHTAPTAVYLATMGAPLGFFVGIVYALRSGRRARQTAAAASQTGVSEAP